MKKLKNYEQKENYNTEFLWTWPPTLCKATHPEYYYNYFKLWLFFKQNISIFIGQTKNRKEKCNLCRFLESQHTEVLNHLFWRQLLLCHLPREAEVPPSPSLCPFGMAHQTKWCSVHFSPCLLHQGFTERCHTNSVPPFSSSPFAWIPHYENHAFRLCECISKHPLLSPLPATPFPSFFLTRLCSSL